MRFPFIGAIILVTYPYVVWYSMEALWKLGLWKLRRNLRRASVPETPVR